MNVLYDQDGIVVVHGDCREVLPTLEAGSVDLVLTDPPYAEQTHAGARKGNPNGVLREYPPLTLVDFDSVSSEAQHETFSAFGRVARAWVVSFLDWHHIATLAAETPPGLRFVRFGVWVKPDAAPQFTGDRPAQGWEGIAFLHRSGGRMRWNGRGRDSVFTYLKAHGLHPTQKPLPLVCELMRLCSNPGDLILDPFAGSGTTGVACRMLGRRALLIERDERYAHIAAERIAAVNPLPFADVIEQSVMELV